MAKKNYNYGKLENGKLICAPNKLKAVIEDEDGNQITVQIINGTTEQYAAAGWLPIRRLPQPDPVENGYYTASYAEQDGTIVESWTFVPVEDNADE